MAYRVYITDSDIGEPGIEVEILRKVGAEVHVIQSRDPAVLTARIADADALIVQYAAITDAVLAAAPGLKVIGRYGIGVDSVDVPAATARGVYVCNSPDYCIDEVADHTLALLLAAARRIVPLQRQVTAGGWSLDSAKPMPRLRGAVLGVVGLGRIGRSVVERAQPFGFKLIGHDPYASADAVTALGVELTDLNSLFARADFITLHMPLTPETHHLVNDQRLAAMRPGSVLVNTARGGLVDTEAVTRALRAGPLGFAALDVLEQEPLPADHPLRVLPNAIVTPHAAYYSEAALGVLRERIATDVARVLAGEKPRNAVNGAALAGVI